MPAPLAEPAFPDHAQVKTVAMLPSSLPPLPTPPALPLLPSPHLLFLGDISEPGYAKTAFGLRDWAPQRCIGEFRCAGGTVSAGLPAMTPQQAAARGARSLVIGVANAGGVIPESWIEPLLQALHAGLDIISGMHVRIASIARLREAADALGRQLIDVRVPPPGIAVATGAPRSGKRLLTMGTDCALGKKYTALALARAFAERGVDVDFRASGQTGILIAGRGMPMDAVVSDFAAGAAEMLSPAAAEDHWDVIEGQGSLFHPAYAGVALALLHGSQPDVVVICHQPGRRHMLGYPAYPLPSIEDTIALALQLGQRTRAGIRCGGVSLDTSQLDPASAAALLDSESQRLGCAVADPMRGGPAFEQLLRQCLG
ncbi:DUF1611 domain-containing protein [Pseudoxanthomonas dokdonensis]|nr:DUF1611 domain-containing protein [Pseudoxanthomonas dokdonensis]